AGNNDHLFWYTSYYDPIVDYMIMSGDHVGVASGYFEEALKTQDVLFNGADPDWGLKASSLNFLHRAAYLTGDGRWLFYRDRTGLDTSALRLGQSFWPRDLTPRPPEELLNTWTIQAMPEPMWKSRASGLPLSQSFLWGSFRNSLDASGDFLLIKGHNGGGRNPYHTFVPLELRLAGYTVLKGYHSQILTSADGMVEPKVAMNGALLQASVVGDAAYAVGHVPNAAFCDWRRTLFLRTARYAVVVDKLAFRANTATMSVETSWNTIGGRWRPSRKAIEVPVKPSTLPAGWTRLKSLDATCLSSPSNDEAPRNLIRLGSIGITLVKATEPGHWIEMPFELDAPFEGELSADLLNYKDRGHVDVFLDGARVAEGIQHHSVAVEALWVPLGHHALAAGSHRLRIVAHSRPEGADRCYIGLAGLVLRPDGAHPATVANPKSVDICSSIPMSATGTGVVKMMWTGPARVGEQQTVFHLIAPRSPGHEVSCTRLGEDAALLALPAPALAIAGKHQNTEAEFAVLEASSLVAGAASRIAVPVPGGENVLVAEPAIDIAWDFDRGHVTITALDETRARLAVAPDGKLALDGAPLAGTAEGEFLDVVLPPGAHTLTSARPPAALLQAWELALKQLPGVIADAPADGEAKASPADTAVIVPPNRSLRVGKEPVKQIVSLQWGDRPLIAAASGKHIAIIAAPGSIVTTLTTDATIRSLHWWASEKLLLAGCLDEKVIAFEDGGKRRWEFVSKMDQAVYEAAKQYWFKSAHPGIWGLDSGRFIEDKQQCFVGSACTLEIIDPKGTLVKRIPVFWGPGWRFGLLPKEDGSTDLLIARQPTDGHALAVVNSNDVRVTRRSYDGVPAGHTYVTGWSTMSRNHLYIQDIDADGSLEVVSEINGFWNRVTVWNADGSARHNAQFGPGERIPKRNVRGVALADLNGDGKQEILVVLKKGLLT
ncbi:MAG: VCBS repeat-containing protein, partial [Lentisphaerae bacterium]|nr:VCBS repeat-containing protein [Lentisphaerota bacterium]